MVTAEWTDARLDDAFERVYAELGAMRAEMREMRADMREMRADMRQLWVTMVAGYTAIVVAVLGGLIATQL